VFALTEEGHLSVGSVPMPSHSMHLATSSSNMAPWLAVASESTPDEATGIGSEDWPSRSASLAYMGSCEGEDIGACVMDGLA